MKHMTDTSDVKILDFKSFYDTRGSLCPIEFSDLPIAVKRIFYVHDVPDRKLRGAHSHHTTNQILVCLSGSCTVIWDEQIYNTDKTILLVLSDTQYDKDDYIKDWNEYLKIKESIDA